MTNATRIRMTRRPAAVLAALALAAAAAQGVGAQAPAGWVADRLAGLVQAQGPAPATLQLSMDQAVQMALETNLGLRRERLNVDAAAQGVASARAAFLPQLTSSFTTGGAEIVPQSFAEGVSSVITTRNLNVSSAVAQSLPWYGAQWQVNWSGSRNTTEGGFVTFNPRLGSTLAAAFRQPLLRNLHIDANRAALETSERQQEITDLQLRDQVLRTEAQVRTAYLGLIAAIARRQVAHQNMDLAQQQLRNSRARVEVGTAARIEVIQSEAAAASNQEQVIVAEAAVATAEDNLRALVLDPARPDYWQVRLEPTDTIQLTRREIDVDQAIGHALAGRLDLVVARRSLEITDLNVRLNRNLTRPAVDFLFNYSATGTGGTQLEFGSGFPPPVLSRTDKSFASVLGEAFGGTFPSWSVGVTVAYPLGRSAAEAALARQQVQHRQEQIGIRSLELAVVTAVRDAARQVETNYQRVQATQAARAANELQLDAEERRFAVGLSTTFEVLQRQSLLAQARIAELTALIAYNQSLIDFERIQKIR